MTDPPGGLEEHLPNWVFELLLAADAMDDRERRSVRRPIGIVDVFGDLARRTTTRGNHGQCSAEVEGPELRIREQRDVAARRERQKNASARVDSLVVGVRRARSDDSRRLPVERLRVEDFAGIGSEAGGPHRATEESHLPE